MGVKKRFMAKRRKKLKWHYLVVLIILYFVFQIINTFLTKFELTTTNEEFLRKLMYDSNHHLQYEKKPNVYENIMNFLMDMDLTNPKSLLTKSFKYEKEENEADGQATDTEFHYIEDPVTVPISNPVVYIYNSHQSENYSTKNYENYGITPNVMMASYLLKDKLNSLGIATIAEEGNIIELMQINNWTHEYSYIASSYFIKDAMKKNPNLKLLIDLHRDALSKAASTVTIDNKNYAKVLFVVGLENENYEKNLNLANLFNQKLEKKYPGLSRGVLKKQGPDVDGVYNQDLSPNMILIEVGGQDNLVSEVNNTLEAVSLVIKEYLEEL